jgi:hypothetical protein
MKVLDGKSSQLLAQLWRPAVSCGAMILAIALVRRVLHPFGSPAWLELIICTLVGATIYVGVLVNISPGAIADIRRLMDGRRSPNAVL